MTMQPFDLPGRPGVFLCALLLAAVTVAGCGGGSGDDENDGDGDDAGAAPSALDLKALLLVNGNQGPAPSALEYLPSRLTGKPATHPSALRSSASQPMTQKPGLLGVALSPLFSARRFGGGIQRHWTGR